jgi:hypothetical protein
MMFPKPQIKNFSPVIGCCGAQDTLDHGGTRARHASHVNREKDIFAVRKFD